MTTKVFIWLIIEWRLE